MGQTARTGLSADPPRLQKQHTAFWLKKESLGTVPFCRKSSERAVVEYDDALVGESCIRLDVQ